MMPLLSVAEIYALIDQFDPIRYGKTRNYQNGGVSRLSPYISRGVISTRQIYERLRKRGFSLFEIEAFVMELCWRDHSQRIWQYHDPQIELRSAQFWIQDSTRLPREITEANTGIEAIDSALLELKATGYMHNHLRMYLATLVCNHYGCHWLTAAKWLFAHLCDADAASNHLSWQWVCGANAPKVYYANQENINKYTGIVQKGSPIDTSYEELPSVRIAATWQTPSYPFKPSQTALDTIDTSLPTHLYTPYHLDPNWRAEEEANKVLFWDLDNWEHYPFTESVFLWINELAKVQIPNLQVVVGRWESIQQTLDLTRVFTKEHPLTATFSIQQDSREWLWPEGNEKPGSFFNYWKKVQKHLRREN
jgi:deoxyribodipyrimidine photo-lyase